MSHQNPYILFPAPRQKRVNTPNGLELYNTGADWIWECFRPDCVTGTGEVPNGAEVYGSVITLERTFDFPGYPTEAYLLITCDNGYEVKLNSNFVGQAQVWNRILPDGTYVAWQDSDFRQSYVDTTNWQSVEKLTINPAYLMVGAGNVLSIDAVNEELSDRTLPNWLGVSTKDHTFNADFADNPGACIFATKIKSSNVTETAWGAGTEFGGRTWATYITYPCPTP